MVLWKVGDAKATPAHEPAQELNLGIKESRVGVVGVGRSSEGIVWHDDVHISPNHIHNAMLQR
jgi:hypothetical protein